MTKLVQVNCFINSRTCPVGLNLAVERGTKYSVEFYEIFSRYCGPICRCPTRSCQTASSPRFCGVIVPWMFFRVRRRVVCSPTRLVAVTSGSCKGAGDTDEVRFCTPTVLATRDSGKTTSSTVRSTKQSGSGLGLCLLGFG